MAESEQCFFKTLYNCGDGKLTKSSRIETIQAASKLRQDNIGLRPELSDASCTVLCHKNCISRYVSPSTLHNLSKRENSNETEKDVREEPKRLRSSTGCAAFDFQKHCLFCNDISPCILPHEYDARVPSQYRIPASKVTTDKMADGETNYKQYLLDLCQKRDDELGRIVRDRILGAPSDLHAADARYHRKCNTIFHRDTNRGIGTDSNSAVDDLAFSQTVKVVSQVRTQNLEFS